MKKLFSLLLAVCMIATFMVTASAADVGIKAVVAETETGATVTISITADVANVSNVVLYVPYNTAKLTFASAEKGAKLAAATTWTEKNSNSATYKWYKLNCYSTDPAKADLISLAADDVLYTVNFTKNADLAEGDIALAANNKVSAAGRAGNTISAASTYDSKANTLDIATTFVPYTPVVEDKTTTFNKVYKADDGKSAAVFGKAPAGTTEAGLYIEKDGVALEHKTAMSKTEKGKGFFPAYTSNLTKAFGVIIRDLAPGNYSAKIYADDTFGDAQPFVIE